MCKGFKRPAIALILATISLVSLANSQKCVDNINCTATTSAGGDTCLTIGSDRTRKVDGSVGQEN